MVFAIIMHVDKYHKLLYLLVKYESFIMANIILKILSETERLVVIA